MYRINFSLFRITLYGNDCKQLHLFYALRGETSRDLMYSFRACHGNCMHRRTCVVSKCVVVWKTAISRREIDENYLMYSRNYSIPHKNEEKINSKILIFWFQF